MSDVESQSSAPGSPTSAVPDNIHTARPYRFTWDPSSRRAGPESVSGTTEGRGGGDYFSAQPRLGLLNTSSSLSLALPQEWSSTRHGFHAISTVLNNPHKRQAPPKAHSALPAVVPADLPRVRRKDFDSYLSAISPEWSRFQHNTQLGREGVAHIGQNDDTPVPQKHIPPLDTVPQVFFDKNFNLADPAIFNAVTEHSPDADPTALAHSLPLLEKFSHYADTVEQHLILEISRRSTSFFAALTNLHDLRSESEHCLTRIASLRTLLTNLDDNSAKRGLQVVHREARADNLVRVVDGVKLVANVVDMGKVARGLVGAGQWGQALGVIDELDSMWEGGPTEQEDPIKLSTLQEEVEHDEPPDSQSHRPPRAAPVISLSTLRAYASLPEHLRALTMEIASSLSSELVVVLRADLSERITRGRGPDGGVLEQGLRDRLRPLLQGLVRTRGLKEGLLSWREVVLDEVRGVVKSRLPAVDADDGEGDGEKRNGDTNNTNKSNATAHENRPGLATHLRSMRQPEFMLLLQDIYKSLLNCVEGLQEQGRIIVDMLDAPNMRPRQKEPISTTVVQDELSDILSSAAELANTQAAKVITFRVEEHAALELADFLVFFNESWDFVVKCEVICRKMIVGLRGVVVSQAKVFLQAFHQARISRSAKLVEDEQWNPAEVSPSLQHITDVLVDSAVRDAPELVLKPDADGADPSTPAPTPTARPLAANGFGAATTGASSKHLRIDERTYFAVSATAEVLVLLLDYLRLVVNLTMLTTDTMSRVIEFLKAFNSRTCQVVLGAGAMRSAGLKNITAKHLALASQSLSIMFELIPYVRETFRRHLSPKQAVMLVEFDKLKRDYQEHQNEIHSKLIAIMGDRLTAHIRTLQAVDWNVPKPGGGVNDYIEILVKETVTLHKVLSRYLSTPVVEYVMTQVFAAINHGLSEEYGKIELPHQEAKTRLLADAKYLHQKLSALKNVGSPSGMLVTVISEKSLPRAAAPTPTRSNTAVPTPTRSNTSISATANQRLKGLLSGKSPSFDKALPRPVVPSSLAHTDADLTSTKPNGHNAAPVPPPQERKSSLGFKQVEIPLLGSEPEPKAGSGEGPTDATAKGPDLGQGQTSSVSLALSLASASSLSPPPPPPHDKLPAHDSDSDSGDVEARGMEAPASATREGEQVQQPPDTALAEAEAAA